MILNISVEEIYFPKTKEYFREVISSYEHENFRSAIVILYSVVICDLLFKLEELKDMYNDSKATSILNKIDGKRKNSSNKSEWEFDLIEQIHEETELINDEVFANLQHLRDHRNFSAHPSLNQNYELITPTREITIAHIKYTLDNILIRPPIFINNVFKLLVEDLSSKKELYIDEPSKLREYLSRKYFDRMNNEMYCKIYKSIWKLSFNFNSTDSKSQENLNINLECLKVMLEIKPQLIKSYIEENIKYFENISDDSKAIRNIILFLFQYGHLYEFLSNDAKLKINNVYKNNEKALIYCWFISDDIQSHFKCLHEHLNKSIIYKPITFFETYDFYSKEGYKDLIINYFISYFKLSHNFDTADTKFDTAINPFLKHFNITQLESLVSAIDNNCQIYKRNRSTEDNAKVYSFIKKIMPNFDFLKYPNFKFDTDDKNSSDLVDDDDDSKLPFDL